jgi:hydroxymethylbilane synthase
MAEGVLATLKLVAATRGSPLALIQVDIVKELLAEKVPGVEVETQIITTSGDRFRDRPISAINEKGVFTKAVDETVLSGEASFAVHSMKDLPMETPEGLVVAAVPERAPPKDALVSVKYRSVADLPEGAVVGSASPRRKAQILFKRGDLDVQLIRGNVDTRLQKLKDCDYDAIILAESGLIRMGKGDVITEVLTLEDFTPSACQGALAVVVKTDNEEVINVLGKITDSDAWAATLAERAFMTTVGGGCKTPVGVIVKVNEGLELLSSVLAPDGSVRFQYTKNGSTGDPEWFGQEAAMDMLSQGGAKLIERWKQ